MSGVALSNFLDFVEGTTSTYVNGPMGLVLEAVKNTYWFGRLIQGQRSKKKMVSGGANIRHSVVFQDSGQFETYLPGGSHTWRNPQRLKKIQVEWRYTMGHMAWVEQEILNNEIIAYGDDEARFCEFVNIRNEKETIAWAAIWNGLENLLWQVPFPEDMESVDGTEPFSIPAMVNEFTNGLFDPQTSTAFTTLQGLTPSDASLAGRYAPQAETYSVSTVAPAAPDKNIIMAFDDISEKLSFEQPPTMAQYWEDPRYNKQMIVTTRRGRAIYKHLLRQSQDHFVAGPQDPAYPDPQYFGIPIQRASTLEGLALYDAGATLGDEFAATNKGPRFYFLNAEYLYPVFHARRYFYKYDVTKHHNVPDTWVAPIAVWYNLINPSRQRQGIVSPSAAVYTA